MVQDHPALAAKPPHILLLHQSPMTTTNSPGFRMVTDLQLAGDQPAAVSTLANLIQAGERSAVLLGVTGSGKTFTMAHVVERVQRPTLVLAPNKTLAAQLYSEFKTFFPDNAVD